MNHIRCGFQSERVGLNKIVWLCCPPPLFLLFGKERKESPWETLMLFFSLPHCLLVSVISACWLGKLRSLEITNRQKLNTLPARITRPREVWMSILQFFLSCIVVIYDVWRGVIMPSRICQATFGSSLCKHKFSTFNSLLVSHRLGVC